MWKSSIASSVSMILTSGTIESSCLALGASRSTAVCADNQGSFYNKTPYSGLEIHIANSYANPLLQLLHFTPAVRNLALHHASTSCIHEDCLLCEIGFLFDMLQKAEGSICQATNMLKTLGNLPQGSIYPDPKSCDYIFQTNLTPCSWTARPCRGGPSRLLLCHNDPGLDEVFTG